MKQRFFSLLSIILLSVLSLCLIGACSTPSEQREQNLRDYKIEGMIWKDSSEKELLVPPGKRVVTFSVDRSESGTRIAYILRPLNEGEHPRTYEVFIQNFGSPGITDSFLLTEQPAVQK